jgi:hypothetical protein
MSQIKTVPFCLTKHYSFNLKITEIQSSYYINVHMDPRNTLWGTADLVDGECLYYMTLNQLRLKNNAIKLSWCVFGVRNFSVGLLKKKKKSTFPSN